VGFAGCTGAISTQHLLEADYPVFRHKVTRLFCPACFDQARLAGELGADVYVSDSDDE
jgi:hypothetical protein